MGDADDGTDDDLRRWLPGVEPLADRGRRVAPRPRPPRRRAVPPPRGVRFHVERAGEHVAARARGVDAAWLERLAAGEVPVERRLDLHRMSAEVARAAVEEAVLRASRAGLRCVLVIHGRGHRSPAGPVLKEALPGWLTAPPLAVRVAAFASAPARLGGPGATLVLLRRPARGPAAQ